MIISPDCVGIDVSRHWLDVFDAAAGRAERLANSDEAVGRLAAGLAKAGAFVLFEATGRYDTRLARALAGAGVAHARVNPGRARDFARAAGFLAKTDAVDARMLAAMAASLRPEPAPPAEPDRERLTLMARRRDQLVATAKQERTRRHDIDEPAIAASVNRHLRWLADEIAALDAEIARTIAEAPRLAGDAKLLRSVPGIGPVTATILLALAPELGRRSPKTIAALAGLAPLNRDSGTARGRRAIAGGRRRLRTGLYMAAVTLVRSKGRFGAFYRNLRQAGKPPKLALIAVARKLLVTLNAILRDQNPFHA
jgi:transposase